MEYCFVSLEIRNCRWHVTSVCFFSSSPAATYLSFTHSRYCTRSGLWAHTQQAGLLQRPVCWLSCQSADTVAVCFASSSSSRLWVAWPCISLSGHAQLVTLAGLSTCKLCLLTYKCLQYMSRLCVPTVSVLGSDRLMKTSFSCLEDRQLHLIPERSPHLLHSVVWAESFICVPGLFQTLIEDLVFVTLGAFMTMLFVTVHLWNLFYYYYYYYWLQMHGLFTIIFRYFVIWHVTTPIIGSYLKCGISQR